MNRKMKRIFKISLLSVLAAMVLGVCYFGYRLHIVWELFKEEDEVVHTFMPVTNAVDDFVQKRGRPPGQLQELVPEYIAAIPEFTAASQVSYLPEPDGKNWRLELTVQSHGQHRIYSMRSNGQYTEQEEKMIILLYHGGWVVMRLDRKQ